MASDFLHFFLSYLLGTQKPDSKRQMTHSFMRSLGATLACMIADMCVSSYTIGFQRFCRMLAKLVEIQR